MIKAKDAAEFSRLLQALADAIVTAHIHYQLYKDLRQALSDYPSVAALSRAFWQLTLNAHINTSMQILCRVYDQQAQALHLRSWLLTIREHLHLFDKEAFRQRLKDNPFVESLAQLPRKPDPMILEEDTRLCSPKDPLVKTLIIHRHSHVAPMGVTNILAARNLHDAHPLTFGDFEALLARAKTILNRYSRLWAANAYATQIIGHDDYQYVFKCVEEKLQRIEEEKQERRRAQEESMQYAVIIEKGDTSYGASVPDLPGCIAVGETLEEVQWLIREAIVFHLEGMREEGLPIPEPTTLAEYIEATWHTMAKDRPTMTMTELADLILTRMYDLAQTQGYAEQFDVRAIAREFGEHEYMKVFNASKVLEGKGWILPNYPMGEGIYAFLTGEGSIAVERGGITGIIYAFRQNPRRFLVVDQSTHYHGPISGQNVAINSQVGSQSSTSSGVPREVVDLLGRISDQLRRSAELDETRRDELLADVQTLLSELQRPTPRAGIVRELLSTLADVATISPWVMQLFSHSWVTQVLSSLST